MVRKPVIQSQDEAASPAVPYPITPESPSSKQTRERSFTTQQACTDSNFGNGQDFQEIQDSNPWISNESSAWQDTNDQAHSVEQIPSLLRAGVAKQSTDDMRTESNSLMPQAASTEATPRSSLESQRAPGQNSVVSAGFLDPLNHSPPEHALKISPTNPYHRRSNLQSKAPERSTTGPKSSAEIWGEEFSGNQVKEEELQLQSPFTEPWIDFKQSAVGKSSLASTEHGLGLANGAGNTPQTIGVADSRAADAPILDIQSPASNVLPSESLSMVSQTPPAGLSHSEHGFRNDADNHVLSKPHGDNDDIGPPLPPRTLQERQEEPPPQPPRPPKSDDPFIGDTSIAKSPPDTSARARRAGETYQIRHVNWCDASSPTSLRRSPIMVQNANGPCPLLALVNALILSTPSDYATALVETLRIREQVSLGLLLDAVIDELIGRNGDLSDVSDMYAFLVNLHTGMNVNPLFIPAETSINLMDASIEEALSSNLSESRKAGGFEETREMKLYKTFAIPLIHGWIPPKNYPAFEALKRSARTYEDAQNLMFREEELEEKLKRQGLSSEEQATLQDIASVKYFLSSTATQLTDYGLATMTESMAPGSVSILFRNDHFSTVYKHPKSGQLLTLVTDMGYAGHDEVVWESLVDVSGEGCEFFSGDFRPVGHSPSDTQQQPDSQHEEGWTTVSKRSRRSAPPNHDNLQSSNLDLPPLSTLSINENEKPPLPSAEQEDHDLALAMHLQEEEEERHREEAAARRREDELSQAYLNSSDASGRKTFPGFSSGARAARSRGGGRGGGSSGVSPSIGGPSPPPRAGRGSGRYAPQPPSGSGRGSGRYPPLAPLRKSIDSEDAPPPTYEQAAKGPAYHPPGYQPTNPATSPPDPNPAAAGTSRPLPPNRPSRQSSAYNENASSYSPSSPSPPYGQPRRTRRPSGSGGMRGGSGVGGVDPAFVRRRSGGAPLSAVSSLEDERKEKDCVVM